MAFVVVYDACVLHPVLLRDLLIRIAQQGIVRARWSDRILDECFGSIRRARPGLDPTKLARTRTLIEQSVPDCLVTRYEHLTAGLELIDEGDRHVVAAAIRAHAQVIVTCNQRHFPDHALEPLGIETKHPDEFVLDALDLAPARIAAAVHQMAATYRTPPLDVHQILDGLRRIGLIRSVSRLRELVTF